MARRIFDFFIFSSLYIAGCAVLMIYQANQLLHLSYDHLHYMLFVLSATICSYNVHWYLTPDAESEAIRMRWTQRHKVLHLVLCVAGMAAAARFFFFFAGHWFWMGGAIVLTFLYSAPKFPYRIFNFLREIAIGKTIFLAFVWMYVTAWLPIVISKDILRQQDLLFCISRFFLIYAICIPFDYRDRQHDRLAGIRSMVTYFDDQGIDNLFHLTLILFGIVTLSLLHFHFSIGEVLLLLIPGFVLLYLYPISKKSFSDYLYYVALDGLMALSALFTALLRI